MEEAWRAIPECDGYEVSSLGAVRTHRPPGNDRRHEGGRLAVPRLIPIHQDPSGTLYVLLPHEDRFRRRNLTGLVAEMFGEPPPPGGSDSVTLGTLAELSGISRSTLRRAISRGLLDGAGVWHTPGGHVRVPRASLLGAVSTLRREVRT